MSTAAVVPADVVWAEEPRSPSLGVAYQVWEALYRMLLADQLPPEEIRIAEGVAVLSAASQARLIPQVDDEPDELTSIDLSSVGLGRIIRLSCLDTGDSGAPPAITVRHKAAGIINSGELVLADGADIVLTSPAEWLWLQRLDSQFVQILPIGAGRLGRLSQNLDMQGYAAFGGAYFLDSHADSARTITTAHRGKQQVNTISCVYTLPMAQPTDGTAWKPGDFVLFRQEAAACSFVTSLGSTPRNLDNHDRGRGVGAKMECELIRVSPTFLWQLAGQTQAAGGSPVPTERTFLTAVSTSTISTDAASTAWKNALSLAHTPGASERWLYLAHGGFKSSSSQSNTGGELRFRRLEAAAGPQLGAPRYSTHQSGMLMMTAAEYGGSPGAQSIDLDIKVGNGTYSASLVLPQIVGIRLEADEFLEQAAGADNNLTSTTYVDLLTLTETFAADDYYVFAWGDYASVDVGGVTMAVDVDGVLRHEKALGRNTVLNGYYGVLHPVTFTAGSKTIKLKGKSNGSWNSTVKNMGICVLRKSNFEDTASINNNDPATTSATAYQDFVTTSKTLLDGWDYLVLADLDTKLDIEGSTPLVKAQMVRNGSRLGQESRGVPRTGGQYVPCSAGFMATVTKALEEDAFALQYASGRSTETAEGKEGTLLLLALARTA
jgi:hypothetical protein